MILLSNSYYYPLAARVHPSVPAAGVLHKRPIGHRRYPVPAVRPLAVPLQKQALKTIDQI